MAEDTHAGHRLQPGSPSQVGPKSSPMSPTKSTTAWVAVGIALMVLLSNGCATPVGVERLDEQAAHRELNANILSTDQPSEYSRQILERTDLAQLFRSDPQRALGELYSGLGKPDERDRLFALAELSFAYAEEARNQSYYLASAVYAYAFLFPPNAANALQENMIPVCDSRLTCTIEVWLQVLLPAMERKSTLIPAGSTCH